MSLGYYGKQFIASDRKWSVDELLHDARKYTQEQRDVVTE